MTGDVVLAASLLASNGCVFVGVIMWTSPVSSFPADTERNASMRMPAMMPLWMEYVNGTTVIVRKDGIAARRLSQSMPLHGAIMKAPIRTSGTEVATRGMQLSTGVRKAEATKRAATTTADSPVRAPSTIPALLSLAMITGLVPSTAPHIVEMAALEKIDLLLGTFPSSRSPAMPIRPYCTPARSKRATKSRIDAPRTMACILPLPGSQQEKSIRATAS
mmetsp:Transcript_77665/g.186336  ORF Transcript_77665/g.186336 Transcript_77665/m.186336 type:complete len:219 (-) Transcript_77665:870-1526(-)